MKACPLCKSTYDDWIDFCFNDGVPLVASAAAPPTTPVIPPPDLSALLDAPDVPLALVQPPEPVVAAKVPPTVAPVAAPAPAPSTPPSLPSAARATDSAARSTAPEPSAPLRIGAEGFDAEPPSSDVPTLVPVAPVSKGEENPFAEIAAVLGGPAASESTASPHPVAPSMPIPSGFSLPVDEAPSASASSARSASRPPLGMIAGGVLGLIAVLGVGWLLLRPGTVAAPPAPEPPVAERVPRVVPPPAPAVVVPSPAPVDIAPPPETVAAPVTPPAPVAPSTDPPVRSVTPVTAQTPPVVTDAALWSAPTPAAPTTGTLKVVTDPEGAAIFVDDQPHGSSPASMEVTRGTHRVRAELAGHVSEAREVNVAAAELTVPLTLKEEVVTGQVNLYGPLGFRVMVDGREMGPMPVTVQVAQGVRQFKLVGEDGTNCVIPREVTFQTPGRPTTVTLQCP